jgi:hypothetical protein
VVALCSDVGPADTLAENRVLHPKVGNGRARLGT